jgi:chromosome segregation ATPase
MADPTIKIKEETRANLQELQREYGFSTMDELQRHLSAMASAEQTINNVSELAPAIEAVKELSLRMCNILSGAGDTLLTVKERQQEALDAQKASFEETRSLLQQRIETLEQERADERQSREAAESRAEELLRQTAKLEGAVKDKDALIEEYKEKISVLGSMSDLLGLLKEQHKPEKVTPTNRTKKATMDESA